MIQHALRSLKKDRTRSLFYWLMFVIVTWFIFDYFQIVLSDVYQVDFFSEEQASSFAMNITVFVIVISAIEVVLANNFFVRSKAKELAVLFSSGATFGQVAWFLMIQNIVLLGLSIPFGILLGIGFLFVANQWLYFLFQTTFHLQLISIIYFVVIMGYILFWAIILNLSFAYRHSMVSLFQIANDHTAYRHKQMTLDDLYGYAKLSLLSAFMPKLMQYTSQPTTKSKKKSVFVKWVTKIIHLIMNLVYIGLWLYPMILMFKDHQSIFTYMMVSIVGLLLCTIQLLLPFLTFIYHRFLLSKPIGNMMIAWLRNDLSSNLGNICLFFGSTLFLVAMFRLSSLNQIDTILTYISFVMISTLLMIAIFFTYGTQLQNRHEGLMTSYLLGYTKRQLKSIFFGEIVLFYLMIFFIYMMYMIVLWYIGKGEILYFIVVHVICMLMGMIVTLWYSSSISQRLTHIR